MPRVKPILLRIALCIALAGGMAMSLPAFAHQAVRIHGHIISVGDTVAEVLRLAGKPDVQVDNTNRFGAVVSEDWQYIINGYNPKIVIIRIRGGIVIDVTQHIRNQ